MNGMTWWYLGGIDPEPIYMEAKVKSHRELAPIFDNEYLIEVSM